MKKHRIRNWLVGTLSVIAVFYLVLLLINTKGEIPMEITDLDTGRHKTVAVFGATGTVGDGLLKAVINDPGVGTIHVITRRVSPRIDEGVAAGKLSVTIHKDYEDYSAIREILSEVDAVFWAIGISSVGMNEADYRKIHVEFPVQLLREWMSVRKSQEMSFHYVSGGGTNADSRMMWAREKARAEHELSRLAENAALRVISYRPAFVTPTETELNIGHKVLHWIFAPIGGAVHAEMIGEAMLEVTARGGVIENGAILENRDIVSYGKAYESRQKSP